MSGPRSAEKSAGDYGGYVTDATGAARPLRLLTLGDLTPQTAAADLLDCLIAWTEERPDRAIALTWVGDGSLRGLLAAQPLPPSLSQTFVVALPPLSLQSAVSDADLLCLTSHAPLDPTVLAAAQGSAGVVLGSARSPDVRRLLDGGKPGWTFDERRPATLLGALGLALSQCGGVTAVSTLGSTLKDTLASA